MKTFAFNSHRSAIHGRGGIVSTSQPLATAAGLEILARGGNAADAAVAAGAALNVTEPTSTGIGGDMFALYYSAQAKRVTALNGSGRAPAALTLDRNQRRWPRAFAGLGLLGCVALAFTLPRASVVGGAAMMLAGAAVYLVRRRGPANGSVEPKP